MRNEQLISDLVDMFFEAKKIVEYLPTLPGTLRKSHLHYHNPLGAPSQFFQTFSLDFLYQN